MNEMPYTSQHPASPPPSTAFLSPFYFKGMKILEREEIKNGIKVLRETK